VDPSEVELDEHSARWLDEEADATAKRNVEILREYAQRPPGTNRITLRFLRSPVEILGDGDDGPVTAIRVVRNRIEPGADGRLRASRPASRRRSRAGSCCARSAIAAKRSRTSRSTSAVA